MCVIFTILKRAHQTTKEQISVIVKGFIEEQFWENIDKSSKGSICNKGLSKATEEYFHGFGTGRS